MIAVVDYGVGNLFSLSASLNFIGAKSIVTSDEAVLRAAEKIILPGVGAFGDAMDKLRERGLVPILDSLAGEGKPFLGISLGMQLLFEESEEFGRHRGLGYLPGRVCSLADDVPADFKIPQIGWNALKIYDRDEPMLKYTREREHVYYVHSFYAKDCGDSVKAASEYGVMVPGLVRGSQRHKNVWGTQFHPEKSGAVGLDMLRAFCEIE